MRHEKTRDEHSTLLNGCVRRARDVVKQKHTCSRCKCLLQVFAQGRRLTGEGLNDYSLSSIYRDALEAAEAVAGGVDPPAEGGALRSLLDGRHQKTQTGTIEKRANSFTFRFIDVVENG